MTTKQDDMNYILENITAKRFGEIEDELSAIPNWLAHLNTPLSEEQRAVMTAQLKDKFSEILDILKIDKHDPNVKSTPMRIASMWVNEWMIGRYQNEPRIEAFPNAEYSETVGEIVSKKCKVQSLCSHHFASFFTNSVNPSSYCTITYVATGEYLGISKITRIVDYYARRPQLQESLSRMVRKHLVKIIGSENVMVSMNDLIHTCEYTRGASDQEASTSTLTYGGVFNDPAVRAQYIK
ncbi:MAG: hypothetical protein DRI86_14665 [Bacteroidetes bacterium]|nr:MAG: hypothetical protein DRI86_14665 [Bacteroidota bacterium]